MSPLPDTRPLDCPIPPPAARRRPAWSRCPLRLRRMFRHSERFRGSAAGQSVIQAASQLGRLEWDGYSSSLTAADGPGDLLVHFSTATDRFHGRAAAAERSRRRSYSAVSCSSEERLAMSPRPSVPYIAWLPSLPAARPRAAARRPTPSATCAASTEQHSLVPKAALPAAMAAACEPLRPSSSEATGALRDARSSASQR